jgi:hypothetical protein
MATDKSEPRVGLIFKVGILAIATLVATHAALVAYFDRTTQDEAYRKIGAVKPAALMDLRAAEKQRLSAGPVPIDKAMQMMKDHKRSDVSPDIMPSASLDTAPMQGWVKLPADVPTPMMMAASASAAEQAAPAPGESGVQAAADAGPDAAAKRDGGAPAPKHPVPKP